MFVKRMSIIVRLTGFLLFSLAILRGGDAKAHPPVSILMDSRGTVYYSDLTQVWKITPDGQKSIAVPNVHTHELFIDSSDNLYGEHLWYEGERTDRWGHRVWKLTTDGTLTDIIPSRPGFRDDYDDFYFVRDREGAQYWVERGEPCVVRKRDPNGAITDLARASFRNVRQMTVTPAGTLYLVDLHDLIRIDSDGTARTVVKDLADCRRTLLLTEETHAIMGLWADTSENVYAACHSDRAVKRITPDGRVEVIARPKFGWAPTGGMIAPNGDLWILEYSAAGISTRVRRIAKSGDVVTFD